MVKNKINNDNIVCCFHYDLYFMETFNSLRSGSFTLKKYIY